MREMVTVRLEIEFEVLVGELGILEQNALDLDLEELVVIWGDQITQTRLMVLLRKLENSSYATKNKPRRKQGNLGRPTQRVAPDEDVGSRKQVADPTSIGADQVPLSEVFRASPDDSSD